MKLLVGGLLTAIAISLSGTAAHAQASASDLSAPALSTPVETQSAPLITQPASINRLSNESGASRPAAPYTSQQLNGALGTLQANPKAATPAPTNSIESLIQRFSTSTPKRTTIDPIDFFKPPALDGGVKIPL